METKIDANIEIVKMNSIEEDAHAQIVLNELRNKAPENSVIFEISSKVLRNIIGEGIQYGLRLPQTQIKPMYFSVINTDEYPHNVLSRLYPGAEISEENEEIRIDGQLYYWVRLNVLELPQSEIEIYKLEAIVE